VVDVKKKAVAGMLQTQWPQKYHYEIFVIAKTCFAAIFCNNSWLHAFASPTKM
jgi:hypothetical protein